MMKAGERQKTGKWGETIAEDFLTQRGMCLVARNVRTQYGELDLVMLDGEQTVFVEVKTRTGRSFGYPEISITDKKAVHILHSAEDFIQKHPEAADTWRVDVVAVIGCPGSANIQVEWFPNALH